MKKAVVTLVSMIILSGQAFADTCGHNLVGEWTRKTDLVASSDIHCGEAVEVEKTVFTFVNKGGKISGRGSRVTTRTFQNQANCSPKTKTKQLYAELFPDGSLSIVSENGAQAVSDCAVSSDRSKLKMGNGLFVRTK